MKIILLFSNRFFYSVVRVRKFPRLPSKTVRKLKSKTIGPLIEFDFDLKVDGVGSFWWQSAPFGQDSHSLRTSIHERIHTCTRINDLQISLLTHARTQSRAACFFRAWCIHFTFPVCIKFNLKHHFDFFFASLACARAREISWPLGILLYILHTIRIYRIHIIFGALAQAREHIHSHYESLIQAAHTQKKN